MKDASAQVTRHPSNNVLHLIVLLIVPGENMRMYVQQNESLRPTVATT
jgi:hypothetical protein